MNATPTRSKKELLAAYVGFWLVAAVFLSISNLSQYIRHGGLRYWEPFLWEGSSTFVIACICPMLYRLCKTLSPGLASAWIIASGHLLGALAFGVVHISGMYLIRYAVYTATEVDYAPGDVAYLARFELLKDLVVYSFLTLSCYAVLYFFRAREREREVAELRAEVSAARLALLQTQLNPHFLFNTLNLISSTLRRSPDLADTILEQVASLLRMTLNVGDRPTHSLRDELRILQPYLDIMVVRFGGQLQVRIEARAAELDTQVPTLILIPIVENAIQHGTVKSVQTSCIGISGVLDGNDLIITVSNTTGTLEAHSRDGGIGLANTRERLRRLYRTAGRIELSERETGGVEVLIRIPRAVQALG